MREDADDGVVRADVRHIGGKTDENHDEQAQTAAPVCHQVVDEVADINIKQPRRLLASDGFAEKSHSKQHQCHTGDEEHAFGVIATNDEKAHQKNGEKTDN